MKLFLLPDRIANYRESVFIELAKEFISRGKSLYLFNDPYDVKKSKIPTANLKELQRFYKIINIRNLYIRKAVIFQFGVISQYVKEKPEIIIAWGESHKISTFIILLLSKLINKKVVLWTHGFYGNERIVKRLWRTFFYQFADKLLVYGEHGTSLAKKYLPRKEIHTIGNSTSIDESKFKFNDMKSYEAHKLSILKKYKLIQKEYQPDKNTIIISFIGRLTKAKKIDLLIKLLSNNDANNLKLWIIGTGSEYQNLYRYACKLKIQKNVHFFGEIYNLCEIKSILSVSDIFTCPNNLGLSVCSALSSGIPVITTKNKQSQMPESECLIDFEFSEFVDFENEEEVLYKINRMYKKCNSNLDLKFKINEHYHKNFNPKDHAKRIIKGLDYIL